MSGLQINYYLFNMEDKPHEFVEFWNERNEFVLSVFYVFNLCNIYPEISIYILICDSSEFDMFFLVYVFSNVKTKKVILFNKATLESKEMSKQWGADILPLKTLCFVIVLLSETQTNHKAKSLTDFLFQLELKLLKGGCPWTFA